MKSTKRITAFIFTACLFPNIDTGNSFKNFDDLTLQDIRIFDGQEDKPQKIGDLKNPFFYKNVEKEHNGKKISLHLLFQNPNTVCLKSVDDGLNY